MKFNIGDIVLFALPYDKTIREGQIAEVMKPNSNYFYRVSGMKMFLPEFFYRIKPPQ